MSSEIRKKQYQKTVGNKYAYVQGVGEQL